MLIVYLSIFTVFYPLDLGLRFHKDKDVMARLIVGGVCKVILSLLLLAEAFVCNFLLEINMILPSCYHLCYYYGCKGTHSSQQILIGGPRNYRL